jgi:thiol:disulfide interchange protein DsbC
MTKSVAFGWVLSFLSASLVSCQLDTCPTEEKIKTGVKELVSQEFTVESIQPLRNIPVLCEVVIKVGTQPLVFYTDKEMKYVMAGNLISLADKKNITRERKEEFMKVSQDLLKELEKHKEFPSV